MFKCKNVCMYVGMCACMFIKSTPMSLHTYLISLDKYDYHRANVIHTGVMANGHIHQTFCIFVPKHCQLQYLLHKLLPCKGQQQIYISICHIYKFPNCLCGISTRQLGLLLRTAKPNISAGLCYFFQQNNVNNGKNNYNLT